MLKECDKTLGSTHLAVKDAQPDEQQPRGDREEGAEVGKEQQPRGYREEDAKEGNEQQLCGDCGEDAEEDTKRQRVVVLVLQRWAGKGGGRGTDWPTLKPHEARHCL